MAHSISHSPAEKHSTVLGIPISDLSLPEIKGLFDRWMGDLRPHYVVTPNPEMLLAATRDARLRQALRGADLAVADGVGVQLASRLGKNPVRHRISGVDVAWELLDRATNLRVPVYFFGGRPGVAAKAAQRLAGQWPQLRIAGASDGGVIGDPEHVADELIAAIRRTAPAVLIVALGHGTQERFIAAHLARLPSVRIAIGVGGAFDYWSGRIRRAPWLLRAAGLEWCYRLVRQPARWPRILRAVLVFPYVVVTYRRGYGEN